jgi:hypothetical protein
MLTVAKAIAHPVPPGYRRKGPKKRPAIERFRGWIDAWLEEDQSRLVNTYQHHAA